MSLYQLTSVYGISEDASYSIKGIANDFAIEAKRNVKIKISADNKTKEATNLITELFKYKQYIEVLETLNKFNSDYSYNIDTAVSDLQSVGNGIYWTFYEDNKKATIKNSFSYLSREINGD